MRLLAIAAFSSRVYSISKHDVVGSFIHVEYIISVRLAYKVYNDSLPDGIVTSAQLTPVWYKSEKPTGGGALGGEGCKGGGRDGGGDGSGGGFGSGIDGGGPFPLLYVTLYIEPLP
tara:strand:- start:822 stop:1169 length:348 start_codon:yes stop_codon:yes gene_type:complete